MVQARRRTSAKSKLTAKRISSGNNLMRISILLVGILIGWLAAVLWLGAKTTDNGVGAGLRSMHEVLEQPQIVAAKEDVDRSAQPPRPSTDFTFFTVLPEIEVTAPVDNQDTSARVATTDALASDTLYMLQVGSYRQRLDADRLKATLALRGTISSIQKVSIEGRGDFYRVRLGPYPTYKTMQKADEKLSQYGFKALRLKMFKSG